MQQPMNLDELIKVMRAERNQRKMSQSDIAAAVGATTQYVSQVESRQRDTTYDKLERWAAALGWHLTMAVVPKRHTAFVDLFVRAVPFMEERQVRIMEAELRITIEEGGKRR